jgi:hypothetical protein
MTRHDPRLRDEETGLSRSYDDSYVERFNNRRAEKSGFRMQAAVQESDLHPLTKSLAPGKHGIPGGITLCRAWDSSR